MDDWIKHDSSEPPELAPAALVEYKDSGDLSDGHVEHFFERCESRSAPWFTGLQYRQPRDEDGTPYISAYGLDHRLAYAVTQPDGTAYGLSSKPYILVDYYGGEMFWSKGDDLANTMARKLRREHRHPGDWRESLYRVWRD